MKTANLYCKSKCYKDKMITWNRIIESTESPVDKHSLTPFQQTLAAGQSLYPESPLYNMAMALTVYGAIDKRRFSRAWSAVVARHSSLQSVVDLKKSTLTPHGATVNLQLLDFRKAANARAQAQAWMNVQTQHVFDLEHTSGCAALLQIADDEWIWFGCLHHLVSDAISFSVLWSELSASYIAAEAPTLPPSSFASYARDEGSSPHKQTCKEFWQNLSIPKPVTPYHSGSTERTTPSLRVQSVVPQQQLASIEQIVQSTNALSKHMARSQLLLCAVSSYLYRVSGQSEIAISMPVPTRNTVHRDCTGPLIEMLPVTVSIAGNETFNSLLEKIKIASNQVYKHASPGAGRWINSAGTSVVFNYITADFAPLGEIPVTAEWLHSGHADPNHLLRFQVTNWSDNDAKDSGSSTEIHIDFNTAHFSQSERTTAIKNWQATVSALIESMLGPVDLALARYDITGNTPNDNVIRDPDIVLDCPNTATSSVAKASAASVSIQFRQLADTHCKRVAITDATTELSYATVLEYVDKLHYSLQQAGISRSHRVALLLPRAPCVPVAMLATLSAGAAFVPVDIETPVQRFHQILKDAGVTCVITLDTHTDKVPPQYSTQLIDTTGATPSTNRQNTKDSMVQPVAVEASDHAYIIYTSGSTGEPKGVIISHGAMTNYISWAIQYYTRGEPLSFPLFTPLGFDLTITSIFVPLLSGGQLHVYPPHSRNADNALSAIIEDNCVDVVKLTPAHLAILQSRDMSNSRIQKLIVGGEDLKCALAQKIHQNFGGNVEIHNEYGPTEATVGCIVHRFNPQTDTEGSVPIGLPVAGMSAAILNSEQQYQPPGVTGELYLEGRSLANGYWNKEKQTNDVFLNNCDARPNVRVYRTGDLVRLNKDGVLVYVGRTDSQIKIRGARIELAEIEAAALSCAHVTECVAVVIESEDARKYEEETHCVRCGLSSRYPQARFNQLSICSLCEAYTQYKQRSSQYFKSMDDLQILIGKCAPLATGKYDCMMLLSGGKDSSYALARLVDLKLRVLAFTLDNGYLSDDAMANISRVCETLGVDHQFGSTPAMPAIFADSLKRHSNVCNGCFKTIYTLGMKQAFALNIPMIFTGLSRGQFFETRLNEELFTRNRIEPADIDAWVLSARKAYHRSDDAVSQHLDTGFFKDDTIFNAVRIVDFYRYCDVELDDMMHYLQTKLPWQRPRDTGRSTNCLINDVGIHVHKIERGYHNYSLPYSWDVRLGHKRREAALQELDDHIDENHVNRILNEINYTVEESVPPTGPRIALYFTSNRHSVESGAPDQAAISHRSTSDSDFSAQQLKAELANKLPRWMMPDWLIPIESMTLSDNGKIDRTALPAPLTTQQGKPENYVKPETTVQQLMASIWSAELKIENISITDNFFSIGGDSITAIRIISEFNSHGFNLNIAELFEYQTIDEICALADNQQAEEPTRPDTDPEAFSRLNDQQMSRLEQLFKK